jgi:N-methylhydantoinase B
VIVPSSVPGKISGFSLQKGDIVVIETAGGGGYGSALERDVEKVSADVAENYICLERAAERYGVHFRDGKVDQQATRDARQNLQRAKVRLSVTEAEDIFDRGRRIICLAPSDLTELGGDDALVELVSPTGAPLRAWTRLNQKVAVRTAPLGPLARQILAVASGTEIETRLLRNGSVR